MHDEACEFACAVRMRSIVAMGANLDFNVFCTRTTSFPGSSLYFERKDPGDEVGTRFVFFVIRDFIEIFRL